ncbi:MAG: hypothetical protein ALECFALPRED_006664 [Alectoria fallacina]|uniref:Fucose-specific lectin n=1 Tax=Alectoria fallacina TaxID=1903189 RepID=A0A8H3IPY6_9LECA|nr:MAG: hypothetical protein ALECFALPRED_006664 [Alectoria fallacina]
MAENYSELQVAPNEHTERFPEVVDQAAHAPERDLSGESPELDKKAWPHQNLSPTSETFADTPSRPDFKDKISDSAPEYGSPEDKDRETLKEAGSPPPLHTPLANIDSHPGIVSHEEEPERSQKRRGLGFWILIGLVALLVVAIALGVGLGVGLTRHKSSDSSSSSASSFAANSTSNGSLPHGIYNDSSVSVVALGDGDKRLLFQEGTGNIREALFSQSASSWTSDINNVVATDARNNTPLAALLVNSTGTPFADDTGPVIFLFYITAANQLASKQFISGSWTSRDNFSPSSGSPNLTVSTATDTRALSCTLLNNDKLSGQAFVFYVAQNGSVESLTITPTSADSIVASPGPGLPRSLQGGHVLALAAGASDAGNVVTPQVGVLMSNGSVYYDLYFSFFNNSAWTAPELQTILVPALPPTEQITYPTSLTLANAYPATATALPSTPTTAPSNPSLQSASYNESLIGDVDIAQVFVNDPASLSYTLFGFWVNGTDLAAYTTKNIGLSTQPKSSFPYSRLAGAVGGNGSDVLLYHQVNASSWAEDVYNLDGGFFTTSYFEVATA